MRRRIPGAIPSPTMGMPSLLSAAAARGTWHAVLTRARRERRLREVRVGIVTSVINPNINFDSSGREKGFSVLRTTSHNIPLVSNTLRVFC